MNSKIKLPNVIDGNHGDDIPVMWKTHYQTVFNCVENSNCKHCLTDLRKVHVRQDGKMIVSQNEVYDIIKNLSNGKAAGLDNITSEHIKHAGSKLQVLLALFITSVLMHGYLPSSLIGSVIVPIIKDKSKRISDKNNYRPIGLSNVCTKILEYVLLNRIEIFIGSTSNQFGFKHKHGTDMCVYTLK